MTSELSNALNPYSIQTRARASENQISFDFQPVVHRPQQHVPLADAISEPPRPLPRESNLLSSQLSSGCTPTAQQILAVTRENQESERQRRIAWEQELEAKYAERITDMEKQALEMRREIATLKYFIDTHPSMANTSERLLIPQFSNTPSASEHHSSQSPAPLTPLSISSAHPPFIEGSSRSPLFNEPNCTNTYMHPTPPPSAPIDDQSSLAHSPSPQFVHVQGSSLHTSALPSSPRFRRRDTPEASSDEDEGISDTKSDSPRPIRRTNHHDTRCLTIQHAMRAHILRLMKVDSDKDLPDSHIEGNTLGANEPVRFVWSKTPKQSVHNARMKIRVLADLKANRHRYKFVPNKEFSKKSLDSVFDQAFITFRQKFKTQRDSAAAIAHKKKEDTKALKSRRLHRKKQKLSNRSDARNRLEAFEHTTFDGALLMECMSSEESDGGDFSPGGSLRLRGLPWRSSRLQRFYDILDDEERLDKSLKPKRGMARKERHPGPPKDGIHIPPAGVSHWMISRRWLDRTLVEHPEVSNMLKEIEDPPGFDWSQFHELGDESAEEREVDEAEEDEARQQDDSTYQSDLHDSRRYFPHDSTTTISSLHYALAS